jgi:hypothetical protein
MSLFHEQEARRGFIDQTRENSGRHAVSYGQFETTGSGEISNPDPLVFGVPYIHMPAASYSYYIEDEDLVDTRWPRCWGGILGWEKNEHGMFTGANAFVIVETKTFEQVTLNTDVIDYTITHFFTFNGAALKFVPDDFASMQKG